MFYMVYEIILYNLPITLSILALWLGQVVTKDCAQSFCCIRCKFITAQYFPLFSLQVNLQATTGLIIFCSQYYKTV